MTNTQRSLPKLKKPHKTSLNARKARKGWLFVLPFVIGLLLIYIPVIIDSIWFSMTSQTYTNTLPGRGYGLEFRGLEYYNDALFGNHSTTFLQTLLSGIQQLILDVPAIVIFSLFIAVVLNQKMLGRAAFRAIFFVPVIIATGLMETINAQDSISSSMQEGTDMGGGAGTDQMFSAMEIENLFANMKIGTELVAYITDLVNSIFNIINRSGVQMLIFLAGLQSISPAIYEASQIEGASSWETFWKITFPMISPMILVNAVYTVIDSFTSSSNVVMSYITSTIGYAADKGLATAMSWIYFIVIILIIALIAALCSGFVFYQKKDR